MALPSMFSVGQQPIAICELCGCGVGPLEQKVQTQKRTMHKECFKCAICDVPLTVGACALDHSLSRYIGPLWFCNMHMMLGSGEKYQLLKQKMGGGK
uniref:LIM zinc-binding domain-containing protein n=1 Tax=Globodera pallida TaxID=36090 RepID=A0A183C0Y1_GLOPA